MKNSYSLYHIVLLLIVFWGTACQTIVIQEDMVKLDKALIPVFHALTYEDMSQAKQANIVLMYRWQQFDRKYRPVESMDDDWLQSFGAIDAWLCDMTVSIEMNAAERAAVQLDHALYEMMDFRYRHQIPYFLDNVWDVQFSYDELSNIINDPLIDLLEWCEVEAKVDLLNDQWRILESNQPEANLWTLEENDQRKYKQTRQKFNQQLVELNKTIECADAKLTAKTLEPIQENILNIFELFGDFESTQTYYAKR